MKCLELQANAKMKLVHRETPVPGDGEVLIKIAACGICGSDVNRILGGGAYHYPLVPGHEFAGTVVQTGPGVDAALTGRKVSVFPIIPCNSCRECGAGRYNVCEHYNYFGSRCDGAYAEYVTAPVWNLVFLPDDLPLTLGALCEPLAVAFHALHRGGMEMGYNVGISGAGPIGMILSRIAKFAGAMNVVIWDIDPTKIEYSKARGNEHTINSAETSVVDYVAEHFGKLDLVIEGTGSSNGLETCLSVLKKHGDIVLMGNPGRDVTMTRDTYWKIMRGELNVHGTWNSAYCDADKNDWKCVVDILDKDREWFADVISHKVKLEDEIAPVQMMADRKVLFSKVMYVMDEEDE